MENLFMGVVTVYFTIKIIYFIISKLNMIEKFIADEEWDFIDGQK